MSSYDSQAEALAASEFYRLGCVRFPEPIRTTFVDSNGEPFTAKADFLHPGTGCLLEFKTQLNEVTTQQASRNHLRRQANWRRGRASAYDKLCYGWNQSRHKQVAVQQQLGGPQRFVVVFRDPPAWEEAEKLSKLGLVFLPLASLASYLACVKLSLLGLAAGFGLTFEDEDTALPYALGMGAFTPKGLKLV